MFANISPNLIAWIAVFAVCMFIVFYLSMRAIFDRGSGRSVSGAGRRYAEGLDFFEQISPFVMLLKPISYTILRAMSTKDIEELRAKVRNAGLSRTISLDDFIGMRLFGAASGAFIAFILMLLAAGLHPIGFMGMLLLAIVGWVFPETWIVQTATERQSRIFRGLSDTLDVLSVSVAAGLDMRNALERVVAIGSEPILDIELRRTLEEIDKGGKSLEAGFEDLRERIALPEMTAFVNVVLMAFRLGASGMGEILTEQADAIRSERVLRAERQANQMGSKILFPIVIFIFPAVIITLLGPMALEAYLSFGM